MTFENLLKLATAGVLVCALTGCVGAVVGVAVDTTVAVVKAPFQIAGAVVGVAADTTGAVIAAPFRAVDAAFGEKHHRHSNSYEEHGHGAAVDAESHDRYLEGNESHKSHKH
jgi:hypothetical protein